MPYWVLRGHTPVLTDDIREWQNLIGNPQRQVATDMVTPSVVVSTCFLLSFDEGPAPLLFETMVFDERPVPTIPELRWHYRTWKDAEDGHRKAVNSVRALLGLLPLRKSKGSKRTLARDAWQRILDGSHLDEEDRPHGKAARRR